MKSRKPGMGLLFLFFLCSTGSCFSVIIQIGDGTLLNQCLPVESYVNYSYSQSIYTMDEIGSGGLITSLGWQYRVNSTIFLANTNQFSIYMGNVNRDRFTALTDWVPLDSLQLVFQDDLEPGWFSSDLPGQGWLTIPLTSFYDYSGIGNLVIAVDENQAGYSNTGDDFYCTAAGLTQSLEIHSMTVNPDPAAPPPAYNNNPYNPLAVRPNLRLDIQPIMYEPNSPDPADFTINVDLNPTLNWQSDADTWDVWFSLSSQPLQLMAENIDSTSWNVPNALSLLTDYHWQVIANFDGQDYPGAIWSFTTAGETLSAPQNLQAMTVGMNVELNWETPTQGTIVSYRIMRDQQFLDECLGTNFIDTSGLPGQTYWYQVSAVNYLNQVSPPSNSVSATLPSSLPIWQMNFDNQADFTDSLTGWTMYDLDNSATWQWSSTNFPGEGTPLSWMVFNPYQTNPPQTQVLAHNGQKMLLCVNSTNPPNNDWVISPHIGIQEGYNLSFWVRSYTADYGLERLRFLVSDSDIQINSFQPLSAEPWLSIPAVWTQISYDLSPYAGQQVYLAWQCVSWDAFTLCLDDIYLTGNVANSDETVQVISDFTIYPNPVHDFLRIESKSVSAFDLAIYNLKGQQILKAKNQSSFEWKRASGHNLPAGIYILKTLQKGHSTTRKILFY